MQGSQDQELFVTGHESDLKRLRQLSGLTQCPCFEDEPTFRLGDLNITTFELTNGSKSEKKSEAPT